MIRRITDRYEQLKQEGRAGLIPFIMGGDPDLPTTSRLLEALAKGGADIVELGIPFSDPMADGPVIEAAGLRARAAGATLEKILQLVKTFRASDQDTPLVLMGYYNPIYHYGVEEFCKQASECGVDGLIIVDLPPEEEEEFRPTAEDNDIALIRLIAPTSVPERLPLLLKDAKGFAYYISITGITGAKGADTSVLGNKLGAVKEKSPVPVAVGFGVKTPEQAAEIGKTADAVVVGSALVDIIAKAGSPDKAVSDATAFIGKLASALAKARKAA